MSSENRFNAILVLIVAVLVLGSCVAGTRNHGSDRGCSYGRC